MLLGADCAKKNDLIYRVQFVCVMLGLFCLIIGLLDGFFGTKLIGQTFEHPYLFIILGELLWLISPYFRGFFDNDQSR